MNERFQRANGRLLLTCLVSTAGLTAARVSVAQSKGSSHAVSSDPGDVAPAGDVEPEADERTLGRHTFQYPILQQGAFNTTHFGIRQGFVLSSVSQLPTPDGTFNLTQTGLLQNIDLGLRLLPWLGLYGTTSGQVITGANVSSLLTTGGTFTIAGESGFVVSLVRVKNTGTQLAFRIFFGAGTGRNITVQPLVNAVLGDMKGLNDVLNGAAGKYVLTPTRTSTLGVSLHAAQALGRFVGLQAALEARGVKEVDSPYDPTSVANIDQATTTGAYKASLEADVDGSPAGFPLGVTVEYQGEIDNAVTDPGQYSSTTSHVAAAGLYYTGRRNLVIGLGGATQLNLKPIVGTDSAGNPARSGSPSVYYGQFVLRYVW